MKYAYALCSYLSFSLIVDRLIPEKYSLKTRGNYMDFDILKTTM